MKERQRYIFICPQCNGHELHSLDRSIVRYRVNYLATLYDIPTAGGHEHLDYEQETCLGYRCGQCHYPDAECKKSFQWQTIQDAINAGAVIPDPMTGKRKVHCRVYIVEEARRGTTYNVVAILPQDIPFDDVHRHEILTKLSGDGHPPAGVVICQEELSNPWFSKEQEEGMTGQSDYTFDLSGGAPAPIDPQR